MFLDRSRLHKHGYQHRCVKILDRMLVDAWLLADPHIKLRNSESGGGAPMSLSDTCAHPPAHEKLTDAYVQFRIEEAVDAAEGKVPEDLIRAKEILDRMVRRDLYKVVCEINVADKPELAKMSTEEVIKRRTHVVHYRKKNYLLSYFRCSRRY